MNMNMTLPGFFAAPARLASRRTTDAPTWVFYWLRAAIVGLRAWHWQPAGVVGAGGTGVAWLSNAGNGDAGGGSTRGGGYDGQLAYR